MTSPKEKRKRARTNRFGNRESTDGFNRYFENLVDEQITTTPMNPNNSVESEVVTVDESPVQQQISLNGSHQDPDATLKDMYVMLQKVLKKVDVLGKEIINLKVEIKYLRMDFSTPDTCDVSTSNTGHVDLTELNALGLPATAESDLDRLDEQLKDVNFKNKLVSAKCSFYISMLIMLMIDYSIEIKVLFNPSLLRKWPTFAEKIIHL